MYFNKNKISPFVYLIFLGFFMQSCLITRDFESPEVNMNEFSRLDSAITSDTISMANISWKDFFQDPLLRNYIDSGLINNYDLQIAEKSIEQAHSYYKQGKAGWWPSVSAGAQVNHQVFSQNSQFGSIFNGSLTQYEFSTTIEWEADIWGKIRSQKRAGEAQYLQSLAVQKAIQTKLISEIANTYYQLIAADKRKTIIESTIVLRQKSLETIEQLKEAGQTTLLAINQAKAQVDEAKILLEGVVNQIYTLENTLMLLTGKKIKSVERSSLEEQKIDTSFQLGLPSLLLKNRLDIKAAEFNLMYYFEQKNIAKTSMYPTLKISASAGFQSINPANWFSLNSLFGSILGGIFQPIFQNRRLKTQHEIATSQMEQSYLSFMQTIFYASMEVSEVLKSYETFTAQHKLRANQELNLTEALDNAENLLQGGFANYLEVLNVQSSVLNVQLQKIDTKTSQLQSITNLYRSLGGGTE